MNILLKGPVDETMLTELVKAYNELEEKGGQLHIFFTSEGGEVTTGEAIIELINRYAQATSFTVCGVIASMGFVITAKVACVKSILDSSFGILHFSRWGTQILEGGKALDDFARFKEKKMKKQLNKSIEFYEGLGLKEDELEAMKKGEDIFVDADRLKKLLKIK